ncbi:hypothetical protein ABWL39_18725 [Chitinivorax sp. PXF-14]|uniref:hypothetical protein n=1 Tax=Chitinivorax sp. PXF-14 TaxID=3230488 RepID=UPI0034651121
MGFAETQVLYAHAMSDSPQESNKITVNMQLKYAYFMKSWTAEMLCQEIEQLDAFLAELRVFVLEKLYPALQTYDSPEKIISAYLKKNEKDRRSFDPPSWFGCSSALTGLILARLYSPGYFPSLKQRYAGEFEGLDEEKLSRGKRRIAYLDQPETLPPLKE